MRLLEACVNAAETPETVHWESDMRYPARLQGLSPTPHALPAALSAESSHAVWAVALGWRRALDDLLTSGAPDQ